MIPFEMYRGRDSARVEFATLPEWMPQKTIFGLRCANRLINYTMPCTETCQCRLGSLALRHECGTTTPYPSHRDAPACRLSPDICILPGKRKRNGAFSTIWTCFLQKSRRWFVRIKETRAMLYLASIYDGASKLFPCTMHDAGIRFSIPEHFIRKSPSSMRTCIVTGTLCGPLGLGKGHPCLLTSF